MNFLNDIFQKLYFSAQEETPAFVDYCEELYYSTQVQGLSAFEQHLEINRLQHISAVCTLSMNVSQKLGLDTKAVVRGAVMHDLFYYDWRDGKNGKWHRLHGYRHPAYALMNARELCSDLTKKEEKIIVRHMWPLTILPPSSAEGLTVSLADKFCASLELLYSLGWIQVKQERGESETV